MTGIDPFTIDQIQLTERSNPLFENHYRQLIDLNYDAILIDNNNEAFNKANPQKVFDCNVYHPNTYYIHGRPNWLCTPGKLFVDIKSKISIQYPCLIKVYKATDNIDEAVPIDILELENEFEEKQIIVNKNEKYVVVITNIKGEKQIF